VDEAEALVQEQIAVELGQLRVLAGALILELKVRRVVDIPPGRAALHEAVVEVAAGEEGADVPLRSSRKVEDMMAGGQRVERRPVVGAGHVVCAAIDRSARFPRGGALLDDAVVGIEP
jgi:hypothetical protein